MTTFIGDAPAPDGPSSPVNVSWSFGLSRVPFDTLLLAASVVEHGLTCPTVEHSLAPASLQHLQQCHYLDDE